ncbi:hypothetical protein B566_EDAN006615 [Ephemera danica]|nr:hypothetical protein B566_EDAN006615 [Ephemera danica]
MSLSSLALCKTLAKLNLLKWTIMLSIGPAPQTSKQILLTKRHHSSGRSQQGPHEKKLLQHLLDPYNVLERPVANESDPLQLSFGLTLMQIIDVRGVPSAYAVTITPGGESLGPCHVLCPSQESVSENQLYVTVTVVVTGSCISLYAAAAAAKFVEKGGAVDAARHRMGDEKNQMLTSNAWLNLCLSHRKLE